MVCIFRILTNIFFQDVKFPGLLWILCAGGKISST